jgi:HK97 gp10 family phage protein
MYAIYKPRKEFKAVKNVRKKAASITVRTKRGREKGEVGRNIKPTKYAHLVEFGTSRSRAFPYMQTTFNRSKHQIIRGVEKGAVSQLTKEFNRLESRVNSARKR